MSTTWVRSLPRAVVVGVAAAAMTTMMSGCGHGGASSPARATPAVTASRPVSAAQLAHLTSATTFTHVHGAPADPHPFARTSGLVVHPRATQVVYASPGGPPVASLPVTELGSPTWVPVVQTRAGWDRILLPSRPDRSTGWISTSGGKLQTAHTPYLIQVDLAARKLTLLKDGTRIGSWPVAIGTSAHPTPSGRTFLLALLEPPHLTYSKYILPLGTHSNAYTTFGGGPGTVGLHTWTPDPSVYGHAVTHGCVRVPPSALSALIRVPIGTLVIIRS